MLLPTRSQPGVVPIKEDVVHHCQLRRQQWRFDMVLRSFCSTMKLPDGRNFDSVVAISSLICVNFSPPLFVICVDKPENSGLLCLKTLSTSAFISQSGNVSILFPKLGMITHSHHLPRLFQLPFSDVRPPRGHILETRLKSRHHSLNMRDYVKRTAETAVEVPSRSKGLSQSASYPMTRRAGDSWPGLDCYDEERTKDERIEGGLVSL